MQSRCMAIPGMWRWFWLETAALHFFDIEVVLSYPYPLAIAIVLDWQVHLQLPGPDELFLPEEVPMPVLCLKSCRNLTGFLMSSAPSEVVCNYRP